VVDEEIPNLVQRVETVRKRMAEESSKRGSAQGRGAAAAAATAGGDEEEDLEDGSASDDAFRRLEVEERGLSNRWVGSESRGRGSWKAQALAIQLLGGWEGSR